MDNKLGIQILGGFNLHSADKIPEMAKVGFETTFFRWNNEDDTYRKAILLDKHNIEIDSLHAPHKGINSIWLNDNAGEECVTMLIKCIDDAAKYHIKHIVLHPVCGDSVPYSSLIGIERYRRLIDYSLKKGVKICFENVEYSEMLGIVMNEFGNDVGFCYDTGHEATNDPGIRFVKLYGDRMCCTHIHDNYGISHMVTPILHGDCHMIPLDAAIDFKRVMKDIRDADYKGALMLECGGQGVYHTYYNYTFREYLEKAYSALKEIASY